MKLADRYFRFQRRLDNFSLRKDNAMTKTFNFAKQTIKRDGSVVPGRNYPVKVADDNSITLRQLNALRIVGFGLTPLDEEKGKDGKDVSGSGVNSPSQIIWDGNKYIAVPYSDEYVRATHAGSSSTESVMNVKDWMTNHTKRVGKPTKGQPAQLLPDPITAYDNRVYVAITGRMKQHALKSQKPLTIDLTGVDGFGDNELEDIDIANEFIGCPVKIVR